MTAEAQILAREQQRVKLVAGARTRAPSRRETWTFALEVKPEDGAPYRAVAKTDIRAPKFKIPRQLDHVTVAYRERKPDKVEILLKGDERYEQALRLKARRREEESEAGEASDSAEESEAANAPEAAEESEADVPPDPEPA